MLRSDHVRAVNFLRHAKRQIGLGQLARGYLDMDAAGFAASGYAFADNAVVGTAMGMKITRSAALADDHIDYIDVKAATQHTTLLIGGAGAGAFTAADDKYTEAGACGVFAAGGGELINVTEADENNGTYLSTSAAANYVVLTALPGESTDVVDDAALTGITFV